MAILQKLMATVRYTKGNILNSIAEARVNTVGVMGKGIALFSKNAFPHNVEIYKKLVWTDN